MITNNININNNKARYDYEIIDTYLAGIVLTGKEIKSIRAGKMSIKESHCAITNNEIFIYNSYIEDKNIPRKLLLHKYEIQELFKKTQIKGYTIVALSVFINHGLCKVSIGLAKGKHNYDKRASIKEKDIQRDTDRYLKNFV